MARILVIDDDDTVSLSMRLALEDADHQVEEAADGLEGMNLFRINPVDLVITDIFMPEKEGLETIDEIKQVCSQTKIIAISGGGRMDSEDYLGTAMRLGADYSLLKPFDIQLVDHVREYFADHFFRAASSRYLGTFCTSGNSLAGDTLTIFYETCFVTDICQPFVSDQVDVKAIDVDMQFQRFRGTLIGDWYAKVLQSMIKCGLE